VRAVLWVQGCTLSCPGCFNPETHPAQGGETILVEELFSQILALGSSIEGITISGGEPFQQVTPLTELTSRIRQETQLSILVFSGYSWDEIQSMPRARPLLAQIDVLIAGRYQANHRLASGLLGSTNKTVHFLTDRYGPDDLQTVPPAELSITSNGDILISGIDPPDMDRRAAAT